MFVSVSDGGNGSVCVWVFLRCSVWAEVTRFEYRAESTMVGSSCRGLVFTVKVQYELCRQEISLSVEERCVEGGCRGICTVSIDRYTDAWTTSRPPPSALCPRHAVYLARACAFLWCFTRK